MTIEVGAAGERSVNEVVGELVHQALWRRKLTQTQFAPLLGLSQSALSKKMRGDRAFDIGELLAVAEHLGVPVTDLLPTQQSPRPDTDPDGGLSAACAHRDSNPGPSDQGPDLADLHFLPTLVPVAA